MAAKRRKPKHCQECDRPGTYRVGFHFDGDAEVRRSTSTARGVGYCRDHAEELAARTRERTRDTIEAFRSGEGNSLLGRWGGGV